MSNEDTDATGMTGGNHLLSQGDQTNYDNDAISQSGNTSFMSVLSPEMRFSADSDEDDTACDGTVPLQSPFLNKIFERIFRDYDSETVFNCRFQRLDQDFQTKRAVNEAMAALLVITEKALSFPFENQLTMMMMLRHFQNCGHKLIILVGELLEVDDETLTAAQNEAKIMKLLQQFLLHETEYNSLTVNAYITKMSTCTTPTDCLHVVDNLEVSTIQNIPTVMAAMKENPSLKFGDIRKLSLNSCVYLMMHQKFGTLVQFDFSNTDELRSSIHLSKTVDGVTIHAITPPKVQIKNCDGLSLFDMTRNDFLKFWRQTCDDDDIQLLLKLFTEVDIQKVDEYNFQEEGDVKKARKVLVEEATKLFFPSKRATKRATNWPQSPDSTSATNQSQSPGNTTTTSILPRRTTRQNVLTESPPPPSYIMPKRRKREVKKPDKLDM